MKNINCYIHIPFCTSKCKYCRFASFGGLKDLQVNTYVNFLCSEIEKNKEENIILDTIYFGGGTPGVLKINQFQKILNTLKTKYIFSEKIEISIESTPENIIIENIIGWKKLGINRISMGVQTLNEKSLGEIGRAGKGDIIKALDNIKVVGFNNLSIDFIIGLPYIKKGEIIENIEYLLGKYKFIKHISVYMLEEYYDVPEDKDSKFENIVYPNSWDKLGIPVDYYLDEYSSISNFLKSKGFNKYEISNFGKPGFECKHNTGYWEHKESLAFGLGAFGFINNTRFSNSESFLEYYNYKNILSEKLNENDLFLEKIMFDLRTSGIEDKDLEKLDKNKINNFIEGGYLELQKQPLSLEKREDSGESLDKNKTKIQLTNKGTLVLDYILSEII